MFAKVSVKSGICYTQNISVDGRALPIVAPLENGFVPGSVICISLRLPEECKRRVSNSIAVVSLTLQDLI